MTYDMPKPEDVLANLRKMQTHNLAFAHSVVVGQAIEEIERLRKDNAAHCTALMTTQIWIDAQEEIERLRDALSAVAGKNDLSDVAGADSDTQRSAAFAALHDCEIIAREAIGN